MTQKNNIHLGILKLGNDYESPRLYQEAQSLGYGKVEIFDRADISMANRQGVMKLFHDGKPIPPLSHVIVRNGKSSTNKFKLGAQRDVIIDWLSSSGTKVLNSANLHYTSGTKLWEAMVLARAGVPTVESQVFGSRHQITPNYFNSSKVVKKLDGSVGKQIWKTDSLEEFELLEKTHGIGSLLIQPYYPGNCDYRVVVIGSKSFGAVKRVAKPGGFKTNALGSTASYIELSEEMSDIAIKAARAMGYEYAGIDIINTDNGLKIIEVNRTPKFKVFEKVTGINLAKELLHYFLKL